MKTFLIAAAGLVGMAMMPSAASAHPGGYHGGGYAYGYGHGGPGYHHDRGGYRGDWRRNRWERRHWREARHYRGRDRWERHHRRDRHWR